MFFSNSIFRAIPEAGYITLGTIRYGVKLSQGCLMSNCTHTRSSSLSTAEHITKTYSSRNSALKTHSPNIEHDNGTRNSNGLRINPEYSTSMPNVCDSDSLSDVNSVNGSCCLNTKCSLPWTSKVENTRTIDLCKSNDETKREEKINITSKFGSNSFFFLFCGKFLNFLSLPCRADIILCIYFKRHCSFYSLNL